MGQNVAYPLHETAIRFHTCCRPRLSRSFNWCPHPHIHSRIHSYIHIQPALVIPFYKEKNKINWSSKVFLLVNSLKILKRVFKKKILIPISLLALKLYSNTSLPPKNLHIMDRHNSSHQLNEVLSSLEQGCSEESNLIHWFPYQEI